MGRVFSTDPGEVQVSVQEAAAQRGDPGENAPPLDVVSDGPEERERAEGR